MIYENHITGVNTFNIDQGTDEWLYHKLGVIGASNAHLVLMQDRLAPMPDSIKIEPTDKRGINRVVIDGNEFLGTKADCTTFVREQLPPVIPEMKDGYLDKLIGQVCTAEHGESSNFKQAEWGRMNEELARDAYEAMNTTIITQAGIIYKDDSLRCGISPDGLDMDVNRGLEIKSPWTTQVHIATLRKGAIKPEYVIQCQYSMWVTGWDEWDFCSYDHRMRGKPENRLITILQKRDQQIMDQFDENMPKFIKKMDEALEQLGFVFGDQWR
jgi:hypothetical protein